MAGDLFHAFKVHVAAELAFGVAVHAHVQHHRARLDHVGCEHIALAHGGHDHVGLQGQGFEVLGARVRDRHRGVFLQQHQRHGFTHNVAAANDHSVFAAQVVGNAVEHLHAAIGCARPKTRHAVHQGPGARDVKAVHVFGGADGFDHLLCVDVCGQRQLHQDAVDAGVIVERFDAGQQVGFGQGCFVLLQHRVQAAVFAGLDLVAHINLAGRVVTHQHHGQTWRHALDFEGLGTGGDFGAQLFGEQVAVDQLGGHV